MHPEHDNTTGANSNNTEHDITSVQHNDMPVPHTSTQQVFATQQSIDNEESSDIQEQQNLFNHNGDNTDIPPSLPSHTSNHVSTELLTDELINTPPLAPKHISDDSTLAENILQQDYKVTPQQRELYFKQLPENALKKMRFDVLISTVVFFVIIVGIFFGGDVLQEAKVIPVFLHINIITIALLILLIIRTGIAFFLTHLAYDYTAYYLDDTGLIIRKGVLWRSETYALRSRIQHIDVSHGPIESLFGLATLQVYTAGTKFGSINLSGLDKNDAEYIRDELISTKADTL